MPVERHTRFSCTPANSFFLGMSMYWTLLRREIYGWLGARQHNCCFYPSVRQDYVSSAWEEGCQGVEGGTSGTTPFSLLLQPFSFARLQVLCNCSSGLTSKICSGLEGRIRKRDSEAGGELVSTRSAWMLGTTSKPARELTTK
jgi:hypothetical protein